MPKPKILILGKLPPPYFGPAVATRILLNSKLKNEFALFHLNTNVHREINTLGVWKADKIHKNMRLYWCFFKMIVRIWPDMILVPISQATIGFIKDSIFILIGRLFNRKVVVQLRGSNIKNWLNKTSVIMNQYFSFVIKKTQGVIVLGNKLTHLFSEYFSDGSIFVVPNGADINYTFCEKNNPIPRIFFLSNLLPSKGIEDVIKAASILKSKYQSDFHLDVVGAWYDEQTKEKCIQLVRENILPVIFHSVVIDNEKSNFFKNADIFVFPPREPEGHPWVILEAMAAGLPIITTDQGAITESVYDGVNGFVVECENPQQIADKVEILIKNSTLCKEMGERGRQLYLDNFTEDKMIEKLSKTFNLVLSG